MTVRTLLGLVIVVGAVSCQRTTPETECDSRASECLSIGAATATALQEGLDRVTTIEITPGALLGVAISNGATWIGASGLASLEGHRPLRPGDYYKIGSTSKTFIAAALFLLERDGVLSLDDPLAKWLPGRFPHDDEITIRLLLRHRSGLVDVKATQFWERAREEPDRVWEPDDVLAMGEVVHTPGTTWSYSNVGYYALGLIITAATGAPWEHTVQNRILTPLSLGETYTNWLDVPPGLLMDSYVFADGQFGSRRIHPSSAGAAGTMAATVRDVLAWCRAFYGGNFLGSAQMAEITTPWSYISAKGEEGEAGTVAEGILGFGTAARIWEFPFGTAYEFGGTVEGFRSMMMALPDRDLCLAAVVNQRSADRNDVLAVGLKTLLGDEWPF